MPQNYNTNTKYYNPYNYSPLSKRVFTPSWRNLISQDIPFSDGVSGSIDVTFEALTPLIVKEGKEGQLSVNLNGEYFIPGTSIKGMVRNVLEIISLSKMGPLVKDNRYSLRDLDGANNDYTLKRRPNDIKAGLMVKINDSFFLIECPDFEKLSYEDIAEFKEVQPKELWDAKSVELKYELVNNEPFYDFNSDRYVLFFTGKMQNKEHEYGIKIPTSLVFKPLEKAVVKDFLFVHEHEVKSKSWSFWKKKIKNFKKKPTYKDLTTDLNFAPVFYTKNNENEIESLGLAFLHRELYKHSVHYFLGKDHTSNDLDLAQCIFGSSEHDFKGRVQFAPAFVDMHGKQVNNIPTEIILGTPKPTFYPFYLKQKLNGYPASTFSDPKGTINGWKRYLVHQKILAQTFPNNNQNVRTKIKPLPAGVTFTCKIRFHNLKPVELGAILSALTFHNNSDKCFHLIGMAKPLGFGKLKLNEIKLSVTERKGSSLDYMAFFEKEICTIDDKNIFDQWQNDIKPLFKIASGRYTEDIHYPVDFVQFKAIKSKRMSIADFAPPLNDFVIISLNK